MSQGNGGTHQTDERRGESASGALARIAGRIAKLGGWEVCKADGRVSWSDETASIHDEPPGFSPTSTEATAYYVPEHRELIDGSLRSCLELGVPFDLSLEIRTATGRRVCVRAIGEAARDAAGAITHVRGAFQDVSEEKANADQMRTLAARLLDTLEHLADGFFTLDREFRFTYLNAVAERLLHRDRAGLLGKNVWSEFPDAVGTESDHAYRVAMTESLKVEFEQFYPPLARWLEVEAQPTTEGIAVYFRDVTERRKDRESLREQATLLDKANDAIIVRDLEHTILYWNQSAERLYGWTAAETRGQSIAKLLYPDPTSFLAATDTAILRGEWVGELEQTTRDGQKIVVEARWTLVRDERGAPRSILAINTDVTRRKKVEAQFLRAQRMESIGALAGGIAHDLNNALAPIVFTVSAMRETEQDPLRREDLAMIETCAQRGADMVKQLLSFARGADGRRLRVDVGAVAAEVEKIVKDTFPKDLTFKLTAPRALWKVDADPTQIHQLLTNLCVNARDAMPHGGTLTIAIEQIVLDEVYAGMNLEAKPGPYVLVRVEDTGTGMPPGVVDRIFEPFFTTKEVGKGTGLGLSTAHSIVRSHGGFIHVYSEVGLGTRFEIYLPADVSAKVADEAAVEQSMLPRGDGELVLVVDDEEAIRTVARRMLERFGYRVILASNGAEAVALFVEHREHIKVVLTDMTMPVMDGPATIVALRALDPSVKIIGSSGLNANGNVAKAVGAGVQHFVPKPYTADTMLRVLKRVLSEGAS